MKKQHDTLQATITEYSEIVRDLLACLQRIQGTGSFEQIFTDAMNTAAITKLRLNRLNTSSNKEPAKPMTG